MKGIFEKLKHLTTAAECAWKACATKARPTKLAVVVVWSNIGKNFEPAKFVLDNVRVCEACAAVLKVDDVLPHKIQVDLGANFASRGLPLPRWETAEMEWRPA